MERLRKPVREMMEKYSIILLLLITILFFSFISPVFFSYENFYNILTQNAYLVIAAVGVAIVWFAGNIDLSIGYQISLIGAVISILLQTERVPLIYAIGIGILMGILFGLINGFLTTRFKVDSMITTLGTMTVFQGISHLLFQSNSIFILPGPFKYIGQGYLFTLSVPVIIAFFMALLAHFMIDKTYLGKYVFVVGRNQEAGKYAGIDVNGIKIMSFALCGFFVAISAIVLLGRTGSASISIGVGTEFTCITAVALGNKGKIGGIVLSVLILGIIANGMQLIGLGIYPQYLVKGIILLTAISLESYRRTINSGGFTRE